MKKQLMQEFKGDLIFVAITFFVILSISIIRPLGDLDEIWNYNIAKNIAEGLIPYREISFITLPFLPMLNAIWLNMFGNEIIVMRIFTAVLGTGILLLTYKILKNTIKETNISLFIVGVLTIFLGNLIYNDYNFFGLFIILIMVYLELKQNKSKDMIENLVQNKRHHVIIGVLVGLLICTKQNVGVMVAIMTVIYPWVFIQKRENIKQSIQIDMYRIIGISIPVLILLGYLISTHSFEQFMSYAVLGISTFLNHIPYSDLFKNQNPIIPILAGILPLCLIFTIMYIATKWKKRTITMHTMIIMVMYSLTTWILVYPIADEPHFIIGSFITAITAIYGIVELLKLIYYKINWEKKKKYYKILTLFMYITIYVSIALQTADRFLQYMEQEKATDIQHYNSVHITDSLRKSIESVNTYIQEKTKQGKTVYILDADAALYRIPLNCYTKDFDMFLKGNLGKDGEEGQIRKIEQIENKENTIFLIRNSQYGQNWQTPLTVIQYIKNNMTVIDEVSIYDAMIFERKLN